MPSFQPAASARALFAAAWVATSVAACSGGDDPKDPNEPADPTDATTSDTPTDGVVDTDTVTDTDTDIDTDTDTGGPGATGSTGDTGTGTTAPYPQPTRLEVTCADAGNPLRFTCDVTVEPAQPVQIRFVRVDGLGPERVHTSELVSTAHTIDLYFMAPQQDYTVEASAVTWPLDPLADTTVTTGLPPNDVGSTLSMTGTATIGLIGGESACTADAVAVVYDTSTGDLVWYDDIDPQGTLGVLDMVRFTDEHTILGETGDSVVEVDLMGYQLTNFAVNFPGFWGAHHDIFKWNGQYYLMYQDTHSGLTLDNVVIFDNVGNQLAEWRSGDHLPIPADADGDYLHTNTIYVDDNGDIYLSWLNQSSVGKIVGDPAAANFGEPLWIMAGGPPAELGSTVPLDWTGIGGADTFDFQHDFHMRHDGRFMVLDNTHGRALVFTIDQVGLTATVDAAYDTAEGSCGPQGTAMDAANGNALVGCDTDTVREYDLATGAMIWQGEVDCRNGNGGFFGNSVTRWYPMDGW